MTEIDKKPDIEIGTADQGDQWSSLSREHLAQAVNRLPREVKKLIKESESRCVVAGGYVRDRVSGDRPSDIDLFAPSKSAAEAWASQLSDRLGVKVHKTRNAITLGQSFPVQFIHRWTYESPFDVAASFDFTVAMAAVWYDHLKKEWRSCCHPLFYQDLASKRLRYTHPVRNEDAGGSLMRVLKFVRRGYYCPPESLAGTVARLFGGLHNNCTTQSEKGRTTILAGLLREVDPMIDPERIIH